MTDEQIEWVARRFNEIEAKLGAIAVGVAVGMEALAAEALKPACEERMREIVREEIQAARAALQKEMADRIANIAPIAPIGMAELAALAARGSASWGAPTGAPIAEAEPFTPAQEERMRETVRREISVAFSIRDAAHSRVARRGIL